VGKKETTRARRTYTPQFKRDAVKLVNEGKSVSEVARDLAMVRSLLQRWRDRSVGEGQTEIRLCARPSCHRWA
jgi:transposase-like protein